MKTQFESYIFKPDEDKNIKEERIDLIGWILILLMILFIVLEWLWLSIIVIFIILTSSIIITISRWGTTEPLKGELTKELIISKDEIRIGEDSYDTSKLRIRRITCDDYLGMSTFGYSFFSRCPMKSNGTLNHLWFRHKNEDFKYRFRISSKSQIELLEDIKKNFTIMW